MNFKEKGLVLFDDKIISYSEGSSCEVVFDFMEIWEKIKGLKLNEHRLVFIHSHPPTVSATISSTDINCMEGLFKALGYPIYFIICCFNDDNFSEEHTEVKCYLQREDGLHSIPGMIDSNVKLFIDKLKGVL